MPWRPQSVPVFVGGLLLILFHCNAALAQTAASNLAGAGATPPATGLILPENWVPDDVDHSVPKVASDATCSLPDVLAQAGKRVEELVKNVDRFTATETVVHQPVDRLGRAGRPTTVKFDYLVSFLPKLDGFFRVDEIRNRDRSLDSFPSHIATIGTSSLVLIFHPRYIEDFQTKCEGLGDWNGHPAWQVRFEQRPDRPNRTSAFIVQGKPYDADLRGRAWILADSYQIGRLDTDEEKIIPKIRLLRSHESIEYRPVGFTHNKVQLWLPSSAELYMDFRGRRFYRKHLFTDFKLFSVDTRYDLGNPIEPGASQPLSLK